MNAREAYAKLRSAGVPMIETAEAAALFGQSADAASKTLRRLAGDKLITRIRSGMWWVPQPANPFRISEFLTAPYPSYLSLHTALRTHAMIQQIPALITVVTLGRSEHLKTVVGSYSLHHIRPELFGGFVESAGIKTATPEKALFDLAYLAGGRSGLKARLPELELPETFRQRELERWIDRIPSLRGKTLVKRRLDKLLGGRQG